MAIGLEGRRSKVSSERKQFSDFGRGKLTFARALVRFSYLSLSFVLLLVS